MHIVNAKEAAFSGLSLTILITVASRDLTSESNAVATILGVP